MKEKTKKLVGMIGLGLLSLTVLASCNSFCDTQDGSNYSYGYDPLNRYYFDSREDALEYANTKVSDGYELLTLDTSTTNAKGESVKIISEEPLEGTNLYYIHTCSYVNRALHANDDGSFDKETIIFSKNSFVQSVETTATSSYISKPYFEYYEKLDEYTLKAICNEADVDISTANFETLYGYKYADYIDYVANANTDKLTEMVALRDASPVILHGNVKYTYNETTDSRYGNLSSWNEKINEYGKSEYNVDLFAMNSDFYKLYTTTLTSKVSAIKTCISIDDGLYGHISTDPFSETVPVTNKASNGFWSGWGDAFVNHGFLEGLFVYPISYLTETFSHNFGMNGWGQIWSVLLVTIIVRLFFMLITLPSTISQQKMQYLQPELTKLQQKYPNSNTNQYEKQRFAQAQMALYKKHNVHPFGSLIVLVIQFPLFISVWNGMTGSASLSRDSVMGLYLSETVWNTLTNTSALPSNTTGWWTALILIILMSASQIVAMLLPQWLNKKKMKSVSKTTVNPAQNSQSNQMKWMQWIMTGFVIIMGFTLPAAMGVYWLAGAIFSAAQSLIMYLVFSKKKEFKD